MGKHCLSTAGRCEFVSRRLMKSSAERSAEFIANNLQPMFSFVAFLCAKEKQGNSIN